MKVMGTGLRRGVNWLDIEVVNEPSGRPRVVLTGRCHEIAEEKNLPVIIHSVHATEDVIQQLRKHPKLSGMVHSYSGSYEQALQLIDMGFYLSFGGAISYDRASKLRSIASKIPLSALLIETDAPDQPDANHQHERNEPAYLVETLKVLTGLRNECSEQIAQQTTKNAKALFNI